MGLLSIIIHTNDADLVSETTPSPQVKLLSGLMLQKLHIYDQPSCDCYERAVWVCSEQTPPPCGQRLELQRSITLLVKEVQRVPKTKLWLPKFQTDATAHLTIRRVFT